jgi:hypothetical protein
MFFEHDSESDHDFDFDSDPAGDFDGDDFDRDPDFDGDEDAPRGHERNDRAPAPSMPMTRRDIDSLYSSALDGTRSFLNKRREQKTAGMPSPAELAIGGAEVVGGAMAAAYLAQRLRQSGLVLPVGLTLGTLTLLASWFYGNKHLMFGGFGLLAGAGAMWAAGHGSLSAEGADAPDVSPNAAPFARAPISSPARFAGAAFAPAPAAPAFGGQTPLTEAQYQNIFRGGGGT